MYLDYSKLEFDAHGMPETPELVLKTLSGGTIGTVPGAHNIKLNVKLSEPSEISFDVPAIIDGERNWIYDRITGHMIIYTKHYGVYVILNPSTDADGISEIKHVKGYSIEKTMESKKFFLEEGTFKFYDQTNAMNKDTVIGHILEIANGWKPGYISPNIAQKYRTFDQYDDYLLSFIYNTAPEKYRCVFVFDPYEKTINVYDADEERPRLPIYLDFDNLLESIEVEELSDELVTAIRPYGSDELDIREANPIGTNWIYDISYFISKGDVPEALAEKWYAWQEYVQNQRNYFEALSALSASTTLRLLAANAALEKLNDDLGALVEQQNVIIQMLAQTPENDDGKKLNENDEDLEKLQKEIFDSIEEKKAEIQAQEEEISSIELELDADNPDSYTSKIQAVVDELDINKYFTDEEYAVLSSYFIEQDIQEDSFVASDIDVSTSGYDYEISEEHLSIDDSSISRVDITEEYGKTIYMLNGGQFQVNGSYDIHGDIIRGTIDVSKDGRCVLSMYAGDIKVGDVSAQSGVITISTSMTGLDDDIEEVVEDGITSYDGTFMSAQLSGGDMFITTNISDYQVYSVKKELYDYGVDVLSDLCTPTYEFSVNSGNFIFEKQFSPFRNRLELGCGVYLNLGNGRTITPNIIEFELQFEEHNKFSVVFSNRFKRHDTVNTLKDMIEKSYSSSRSFDAGKYIYNKVSNQATQVSQFMSGSLDAAVNTIKGASNQSVVINGSGIHIGGNSKYQIRIVDSMIAMSDDNWETSKLALGYFHSDDIPEGGYFGVHGEVIGGKLIVGNNCVLENATDDGVMQFKVDSSGAWLNNSTFVLQKDDGGKIIIDPLYGIVAGNGSLYDVDGTSVYPSFIKDGKIETDDDGFPVGANFYLDIRNGNTYIRGKVVATSGEIGGFNIEEDYLHSGSDKTFVALNGSGDNEHSEYAIWAGARDPGNAPFWVKKNGDMSATNGTFSGKLKTSELQGSIIASGDDDWLEGCGIMVGYNPNASTGKNYNFYVDQKGNTYIEGSVIGSSEIRAPAMYWGDGGMLIRGEGWDGTKDNSGKPIPTEVLMLVSDCGLVLEAATNMRIEVGDGKGLFINMEPSRVNIGGKNLERIIRDIASEYAAPSE